MASRVSRKSTTTTTTTSGETPSRSGASPGRTRSPSPARITRIQEKEQLQNLNDRLASYIDRVRYLEGENSRLQLQVRSSEEVVSREVTNIKALYESELDEARKLVDDISKEKAKLLLDLEKYKTESGDWHAKYTKRDRDAKNAEKQVLELQSEVGDVRAQLNDAENAKKHAEAEAARLRGEVLTLERQLASLKKQLEDETIKRVEMENKYQTLKEKLDFQAKVHEQEINESRLKTVTIIDEVDARASEEYDAKLQEALNRTREEYDEKFRNVRIEVEDMYEKRLMDMQRDKDRSMTEGSNTREEYLLIKQKADKLNSEVVKLRAQNAELESRITDLENQLQYERDMFNRQLNDRDMTIEDLHEQLNEQTREYADLLEIKLKLDNEIDTYRKLLEAEEERLNISQSSSELGTPKKGGRGIKRKRVTLDISKEERKEGYGFSSESSATGPLEIHDTDHNGQFVTVFNTGDDDIVLGGHILKLTVNNGEKETIYKFHRNLQIKAGHKCTVWSSNSGKSHNPPTDLVMKGQQWFTGDHMKTVLLLDDKEVASKVMEKESKSSTYRYVRPGELDDEGRERCSIM